MALLLVEPGRGEDQRPVPAAAQLLAQPRRCRLLEALELDRVVADLDLCRRPAEALDQLRRRRRARPRRSGRRRRRERAAASRRSAPARTRGSAAPSPRSGMRASDRRRERPLRRQRPAQVGVEDRRALGPQQAGQPDRPPPAGKAERHRRDPAYAGAERLGVLGQRRRPGASSSSKVGCQPGSRPSISISRANSAPPSSRLSV